MMKSNFHTHTSLCKHAEGSLFEMAEAAERAAFDVFGITEHTPLPQDRWLDIRMAQAELPQYLSDLHSLKQRSSKTRFLAGMECDHAKEFIPYYENELLGSGKLDFLIGSIHFFPYQGEWRGMYGGVTSQDHLKAYTDHLIELLHQKIYAFIAHPDLFANSYLVWDDCAVECSIRILEAARVNHKPLEINAYGLRKPPIQTPAGPRPMYPLKEFWQLAGQYGISVFCNSDAHRPQDVDAGLDECRELAAASGVKVLDKIDLT
jgi:histidinol-phosphatase (PHP family)